MRVETVGSAPMRIGAASPESACETERRQRRTRMFQENLAIARDLDAAPVALEDRDAQNLFQFADRLGHGGLADMQQFGRLHHALLPCHLDKCLEMAKLDPAVDHLSHNS